MYNSKSMQSIATGKIAIFGSGEMSPTGRRVHEYLIKDLTPPVKIALLETPTGFEANPHNWYMKLEEMLRVGLQNYKPHIERVAALRFDGENSTNNPLFLAPLQNAHYIHSGAGSPSYAARHLRDSVAYKYIKTHVKKHLPLSLGSATTIAFSKYLLPVYEIYKAGEELHWKDGLNFFQQWDLDLTFIPHWNNHEGGKNIDTSRCYMGTERFQKLLKILPGPTTIIGIDEQTALIFDLGKKTLSVMGAGKVTIQKEGSEVVLSSGSTAPLSQL